MPVLKKGKNPTITGTDFEAFFLWDLEQFFFYVLLATTTTLFVCLKEKADSNLPGVGCKTYIFQDFEQVYIFFLQSR